MQQDDRLKLFKSIAKNYDRYQQHIAGIDDKIALVRNKMENVHSIDYDKPAGTPSFNERPVVDLIEKKAALEKEKQYYQSLVSWVDQVIGSLDSGAVKALIWMSCVKRRSLGSIADECNISRDYLYRVRRLCLVQALDDNMIDRLDTILRNDPGENARNL